MENFKMVKFDHARRQRVKTYVTVNPLLFDETPNGKEILHF